MRAMGCRREGRAAPESPTPRQLGQSQVEEREGVGVEVLEETGIGGTGSATRGERAQFCVYLEARLRRLDWHKECGTTPLLSSLQQLRRKEKPDPCANPNRAITPLFFLLTAPVQSSSATLHYLPNLPAFEGKMKGAVPSSNHSSHSSSPLFPLPPRLRATIVRGRKLGRCEL